MILKKALLVVMALFIAFSSVPAFAYNQNETDVVWDVVALRPLGFGALIMGTALYVISLPVTVITNSYGKVGKNLVTKPFKYTFIRKIGDIEFEE